MEMTSHKAALLDQILVGDCLAVAAGVPSACVDLAYIDPPYFTKRSFEGAPRRAEPALARNGEADGATHPVERLGFDDRWTGGRLGYLSWLEERVVAIHRALKPDGVFLLHLDWHAVHYAKVMCDAVFGDDRFENELIWYYQTGGASKGRFSRKHDTILMYAKSDRFYFDGKAIAIPRTEKAMKRAACPTGARIKASDTHKNPDDVLMVPALNPMAIERTGYPTQKPLALLELLVKGLCPPGGVVADFFCGSGTTLVAARRLGRHFVGCDISPKAVALARRRVEAGI